MDKRINKKEAGYKLIQLFKVVNRKDNRDKKMNIEK